MISATMEEYLCIEFSCKETFVYLTVSLCVSHCECVGALPLFTSLPENYLFVVSISVALVILIFSDASCGELMTVTMLDSKDLCPNHMETVVDPAQHLTHLRCPANVDFLPLSQGSPSAGVYHKPLEHKQLKSLGLSERQGLDLWFY